VSRWIIKHQRYGWFVGKRAGEYRLTQWEEDAFRFDGRADAEQVRSEYLSTDPTAYILVECDDDDDTPDRDS
jgi:hypothetical protein